MEREQKIEMLERQLKRLQQNFRRLAENSEEADMVLDWINEIRKKITKLKNEKNN